VQCPVRNKRVVNAKQQSTLLHTDGQNQAANDRASTSNNLPADAKGSSTAGVTYCSLKGKPRNHILLATGIVEE